MMIDAHVSFNEPYSYDLLMTYVKKAQEQGINELVIVEPSHKFLECALLYTEVKYTYQYQLEWYEAIPKISIHEYQAFVKEMRQKEFPIHIKFGLCVCYFTQHEQFIKQMKKEFAYDCFVGKIEFVDNIAFAWPQYSNEMLWDKYNADFLYRRYYEMMNALITSKLFDGVSGFDNIKIMRVIPKFKMQHTYHKMAMLLALQHMYVEDDTSLKYQYGHEDKGLCKAFKDMCTNMHVAIYPCSNAKKASEIGKLIQ